MNAMKRILKTALPALLLALPALFLLPSAARAQERISAEDIIRTINNGQAVDLSDAVITGTLDLTEIATKTLEKNDHSNKAYKSKVNVPLAFRDCRFKGDVIAYKVLDNEGKQKKLLNWSGDSQVLYTADFAGEVIFENCTFEGMTEFKYSDFAGKVSFAGSEFASNANFKYAQFHAGTNFSQATFPDEANFKYAQFGEESDFSSARLEEDAIFKYASFKKVVNFQGTSFGGYADFKYTTFKQPTDFQQTSFAGGSDFKYTSGSYRL